MNQSVENTNWIVELSNHSLILVRGADAVKFLQGQVTCDIEALSLSAGIGPSVLGAHCTHKGRMLFTFRAFCIDDDTVALMVYRELVSQVMDSLGKYIVFSKAELIDAQADYQLLGIEGETATTVLKHYIPHLSDELDSVSVVDAMTAICLGHQRYQVLLSLNSEEVVSGAMERLQTVCESNDLNFWTLGNIRSGIGEVRRETVGEFIPQMLNLQAVGNGISFSKGCYTGQEIVARMKYLGKLKRQMYRLRAEADLLPNPGDPIYSLSAEKPVGSVVIASRLEDSVEMLAVVTSTAIEEDALYLHSHHQVWVSGAELGPLWAWELASD